MKSCFRSNSSIYSLSIQLSSNPPDEYSSSSSSSPNNISCNFLSSPLTGSPATATPLKSFTSFCWDSLYLISSAQSFHWGSFPSTTCLLCSALLKSEYFCFCSLYTSEKERLGMIQAARLPSSLLARSTSLSSFDLALREVRSGCREEATGSWYFLAETRLFFFSQDCRRSLSSQSGMVQLGSELIPNPGSSDLSLSTIFILRQLLLLSSMNAAKRQVTCLYSIRIIIYLELHMLSNLQACSPDHKGMLEFMCYGNEKSYCKGCYKKHKNTCASSRCGDAKKLCYAILEKVEYYKLKARLLDANLSLAEYNDLKDAFGNIYLNFTNLLKQYIQRKVPFFVLQLENQLIDNLLKPDTIQPSINAHLQSSTSQFDPRKFDQLYVKLKNLTLKDKAETTDMDFIVSEMNEIERLEKVLKEAASKRTSERSGTGGNKGKEIIEMAKQLRCELEYGLNVRDEIDRSIMGKIREISWRLSKGNTTKAYCEIQNIRFQDYQKQSLPELQQNPEMLLDIGKHVMKKTLFSHIDTMKFPYKYAYVISTCPSPDVTYEQLILNLQKKLAMTIHQRTDAGSLSNTLQRMTRRVLIMGPQLIDLQFSRQPHKKLTSCTISIYGYDETREPFYKRVVELLGISRDKIIERYLDQNKKKTPDIGSVLDRTYYVIGVAYQLIFKENSLDNQEQFKEIGKELVKRMLDKGLSSLDFDRSRSQQAIRLSESI